MLKAKIIKTGEIVEIYNYSKIANYIEYNVEGMSDYASLPLNEVELIFDDKNNFNIDYNKELFDIAKQLYIKDDALTARQAFDAAKEFIDYYKKEIRNEKV